MNTTKMSKLALAIGTLAIATGAMAVDSGVATLAVTASIAPECAVGNTTAMEFGDMTMLTARGEQTTSSNRSIGGTFDAICTNGTNAPSIRFTSSNSAGPNFRLLGADGTSFIVYSLTETTSSGVAITPGNNSAFTGFAADGTIKSLKIVAMITAAAKQTKRVQNYSDTITITTSYTP